MYSQNAHIRTLPSNMYDPTGWWVGFAGPYRHRDEAERMAALMQSPAYYCDSKGRVVNV